MAESASTVTASPTRPRFLMDQTVTMRDGTQLTTDVYLPPSAEAAGAVLIRSPYGIRKGMYLKLGKQLSRAGFCAVLQNMRPFGADGDADLSIHREGEDCYDTMSWLSTQDWCDGSVALFGISVSAFSAFLALGGSVPAGMRLTGLVSVGGIVSMRHCLYPNGALRLHWFLPWCTMMDARIGNREHGGNDAWRTLPWSQLLAPGFRNTLAELGPLPDLWRLLGNGRAENLQHVPEPNLTAAENGAKSALLISGFFDTFLDETLTAYQQLRTNPNNRVSLIIGPWDHQSLFFSLAGVPAPEGPCTEARPLNLLRIAATWYHARAIPEAAEPAPLPPVLIYLRAHHCWLAGSKFPLPGTRMTTWYLSGTDAAHETHGGGHLTPEQPHKPGVDEFYVDVAKPVPTRGGALWAFGNRWAAGPEPQDDAEPRGDVLTFTGAALVTPLTVVGVVRLQLWAASDLPFGDLAAKLVDVAPSGEATLVQDGLLRTRRTEDHNPSVPQPVTVTIGACAHEFAPGHRIRLEIAGSNFPKYDTHPDLDGRTGLPKPQQRIFHGPGHPSSLTLPVIDPSEQQTWGDEHHYLSRQGEPRHA